MSKSTGSVIEEILHELIDVAAGTIAILTPGRAAVLHEKITPGHTDVPLSAEEQAKLEELQARQDRLAADKAAREQAAAPASEPAAEAEAAAPSGV